MKVALFLSSRISSGKAVDGRDCAKGSVETGGRPEATRPGRDGHLRREIGRHHQEVRKSQERQQKEPRENGQIPRRTRQT